MSLRTTLGGFALCLAFALAQAQERTVIMTDWAPHGLHAGLHLAAQKGWFKDAGLNVEVQDGRGSGSTIQQIAAGKVDVGFVQLGAMAPAVANGLPVTSIMGMVRAGDNGLMVPASANFKSLKDLKGRKIAVPAGSATVLFLDAFLKAGGLSRSDLTVISVDSQAMVSTYTSGQVDGALSTVAFFAPIVAAVRPSAGILFSDVGLRVPGHGLVVRDDALEKRADYLAKVVAVNKRAWEYIFQGHEEEAVDAMLAQRAGLRLDRNIMLGQLKGYMPLFNTAATKGKPIGWQADEDWHAALSTMQDVGMVKPGWKTSTYYTNKFIH